MTYLYAEQLKELVATLQGISTVSAALLQAIIDQPGPP